MRYDKKKLLDIQDKITESSQNHIYTIYSQNLAQWTTIYDENTPKSNSQNMITTSHILFCEIMGSQNFTRYDPKTCPVKIYKIW